MEKWTIQKLFQSQLDGTAPTLNVPLYQLKAAQAIGGCRTEAMGSHAQFCANGHLCGVFYNSCRHRGCPQCQFAAKERWLAQWSARLLNVKHHHWIFTVPHLLLALWRYNREWFQDKMYLAVSHTLKQLSRSKAHLGAQPGYLLALHTWGRNLSEHPHIHCLITHGGLDSTGKWVSPKRGVMFPVKVMRRLFRGKFLAAVKQALAQSTLVLPPEQQTTQVTNLSNKLGRIDWQVYACAPYAHGLGVAKYLARYMRGGAINNSQITSVKNNVLTFKYKSHQTKKTERQQVSLPQFSRMVLRHLPLKGKPTIRYYGVYHPTVVNKLNLARGQFKQSSFIAVTLPTWQDILNKLGTTLICPECGIQERIASAPIKR